MTRRRDGTAGSRPAGTPGVPVAQPGTAPALPGGHRRRRRPRPGHRALPRAARRHRRRGAGDAAGWPAATWPATPRSSGPTTCGTPPRRSTSTRSNCGSPGRRPRLPDPVLPARGAEPGPLAAGCARLAAPGGGQPAQRGGRRVGGRRGRPGAVPDPEHLRRPALPGARRHLPAARRHRQTRLRGLGFRPLGRRGRHRPDPELRGHRHRRRTTARCSGVQTTPRSDRRRPGGDDRRRALRGAGRRWPDSGCRCSRTRCRRWCPSCWSRCTRPW